MLKNIFFYTIVSTRLVAFSSSSFADYDDGNYRDRSGNQTPAAQNWSKEVDQRYWEYFILKNGGAYSKSDHRYWEYIIWKNGGLYNWQRNMQKWRQNGLQNGIQQNFGNVPAVNPAPPQMHKRNVKKKRMMVPLPKKPREEIWQDKDGVWRPKSKKNSDNQHMDR